MSVSRLLPSLLLFACSADPLPSGHYVITTGQETDTYTLAPAPVLFQSTSIDSSGNTKELETSDTPIESIDVGTTGAYFFQLQGSDANGERRVQATSYYLSATQMAGYAVQLFAGRTDAFCRPPGNLSTAVGVHPPVGLYWGQYLWVIDNATAANIISEGYDLVGWQPSSAPTFIASASCPRSPCAVLSVANYAGQYGLAIGSDWAMSLDVTNESTASTSLPAGLSSWADVAGGRTLNANTGAAFVVGATRTDTASSAVLELATDGTLKPRIMAAPRLGAAATYIDGVGLVVSGGSDVEPGVEFLPQSGTTFIGVPYPADSVVGAALVPELTGTRVWRIGGYVAADNSPAPTVVYDSQCTSACVPEAKPEFDLDVRNAQGFKLGQSRLVIGEAPDGTMLAWRLTDTAPVAIPLREPRKYSSVYGLPNGFAALIGGIHVSDGTPATAIELVAY